MRTKYATHAPRLDRVVQLRRRAVVVDIADLLLRSAGLRQRRLDAADDFIAIGIHLHAVIGIAGRRITLDARVAGGAARARAVLALEHDHVGAFAEHEAIAVAIEGTRRVR